MSLQPDSIRPVDSTARVELSLLSTTRRYSFGAHKLSFDDLHLILCGRTAHHPHFNRAT